MASTLVVSDLDGTLLGSDASLSDRGRAVLDDFIADGGLFTYATARGFSTATEALGGLRPRLPVITYGGAIVVDPLTGHGEPAVVPRPELETLLAAVDAGAVILFVWHDERDRLCWWQGRETPGVRAFLTRRRGDPRLLPLPDWSAVDLSQVFYVALPGERAVLEPIAAAMTSRRTHVTLSPDNYEPGLWSLEMTSVAATKAAAVHRVLTDVGAERLVCFGDNHNDLPMFALADHAVAVANAVPEALVAADEVIGRHGEDAVADWIAAHRNELLAGEAK